MRVIIGILLFLMPCEHVNMKVHTDFGPL